MTYPIKKITYQDLHKTSHTIKQLRSWHEELNSLLTPSKEALILKELVLSHNELIVILEEEILKLQQKEKLKNFWV